MLRYILLKEGGNVKRKLIPVFLLLLVFLTGCGKEKTFYGSVVRVETGPEAVVLEDGDGKRMAFLTGEVPVFASMVEGEKRDALGEHMSIQVTYSGRRSAYTAPDGETYPCYKAGYVYIDEIREEMPVRLSDGTEVWLWKGTFQNRWRLEDGTVLLFVDVSQWRGRIASASEAVNQKIADYFREQGELVDVGKALEEANLRYLAQADKTEYQEAMVRQSTELVAESSRVLYFSTTVGQPQENGDMTEYRLGVAFDRETGKVISMEDLFTCGKDEIITAICEAAKLEDEALLRDMEKAFRLEYLIFWADGLEVWFPEGAIPAYETAFVVGLDMADIESVLEPWAVPISQE